MNSARLVGAGQASLPAPVGPVMLWGMYAEFFGLKQDPFSIAPDPRYLFMSERHREALAHLLYGIGEGGSFVQLTGEVGTGKTTVARMVADLYKALGILKKGHVVEADCSKLIAAYIGQTPIKTQRLCEEARGGVLFIDEAYGLTGHQHQGYGPEAIETLLKFMEDNRGDIVVIVAQGPQMVSEQPAPLKLPESVTQIGGRWSISQILPVEPEFIRISEGQKRLLSGAINFDLANAGLSGLPLPMLRPESALLLELIPSKGGNTHG